METLALIILFIFIGIPLLVLLIVRTFWPVIETYLYASHQEKFTAAQHSSEDMAIDLLTRGSGLFSLLIKLAFVVLALCGLYSFLGNAWDNPGKNGIKAAGSLAVIGTIAYLKLRR